MFAPGRNTSLGNTASTALSCFRDRLLSKDSTQLLWLARLDHSHCNSADPLTDGLEVCCVFYRPGPGGAMCVVWWWKVLESRERGGMRHRGVGGRGGAAVAG